MLSSRISLNTLLAAAALSMVAATSTATPTPTVDRSMKATYGRTGSSIGRQYHRPGWSVAQGKRRSLKARNVARNRRAHSRAGR